MRVLVQRVKKASVEIPSREVSKINQGLLIFLGITSSDDHRDINYLVNKIINLRIFPNKTSSKNFEISLLELEGEILVVSQFTLYAKTRVGRRPDFSNVCETEKAKILYQKFLESLNQFISVKKGVFGEEMQVSLVNWGPVTMMIDSAEKDKPRNLA